MLHHYSWCCGWIIARRFVFSRRQSINPSMNSVLKFSTLEITWQVDHTDPYHTALLRFNNLWAAEYAHNSLLVYSTGRSPHKYEELHQQVPLLTPSIGIFSVGTEILYGSSLEPDQGWVSLLDDGWDRGVALKELQRFTNLRMQVCIFKCMCMYIHIHTWQAWCSFEGKNRWLVTRLKLSCQWGKDLELLPGDWLLSLLWAIN
jgi:hypothetical protein